MCGWLEGEWMVEYVGGYMGERSSSWWMHDRRMVKDAEGEWMDSCSYMYVLMPQILQAVGSSDCSR